MSGMSGEQALGDAGKDEPDQASSNQQDKQDKQGKIHYCITRIYIMMIIWKGDGNSQPLLTCQVRGIPGSQSGMWLH